jgi:hypothetical protein
VNLKGKSFKKSAKFLILLLTSIVIASVSAGVYYSLSMTSTITTATTDVWFVLGADNGTAGVSLSPQNTSAILTDLLAYPNATYTYIDPIRVRNNGSIAKDIRLRHIDLSGNDTEFDYIKFQIRNGTTETDVILRTLTYNCTGSGWTLPTNTTYVSIPDTTEWSVTIETKAVDDAVGASVTIEIAVDVK